MYGVRGRRTLRGAGTIIGARKKPNDRERAPIMAPLRVYYLAGDALIALLKNRDYSRFRNRFSRSMASDRLSSDEA